MRNICFVTPHKPGPSETFILAHMERIQGNIFHLYSYGLDYSFDGIPLRTRYSKPKPFWHKFLHVLPYYYMFRFYYRLQQKCSDLQLVRRFLKERDIDLVFVEYGTAGAVIAPVCASLNIPLIVHFHGFDVSRNDIIDQFATSYKEMFRIAFRVIAVSHSMGQRLIALGCPVEKLVYNPCGPHSDFFNATPSYQSNAIVCVGRQTYKKAPYLTILAFYKALAACPSLELYMVGIGELFEVSRHIVRALGLENRVFFPGVLERDEILQLFSKSFMYIQHSLKAANGDSEGTPVGILEAMAAGLPVVSTRHEGILDVVLENETGFLVDEGDVEAMAQHIINLAEDRTLAKQMGTSGRMRVAMNFTLEKHLCIIEEHINLALLQPQSFK